MQIYFGIVLWIIVLLEFYHKLYKRFFLITVEGIGALIYSEINDYTL
jgi:hypothetical protein